MPAADDGGWPDGSIEEMVYTHSSSSLPCPTTTTTIATREGAESMIVSKRPRFFRPLSGPWTPYGSFAQARCASEGSSGYRVATMPLTSLLLMRL